MTKPEAKKLIKEHYKGIFEVCKEKIVDCDLWDDDGYMFHIITISENHVPFRYAGYFEGNEIIELHEATALLTVNR